MNKKLDLFKKRTVKKIVRQPNAGLAQDASLDRKRDPTH